MIKKILVAYDASEASEKAFRYALDIASRFQADIEIFGVIRPPDFGGTVEATAMIEDGKKQFHEHTRALRDQAHAAGVKVHYHLAVGQVADQIVTHAHDEGFDLIVIGHRGKSLIQRWLTGSTAKQVMGYAHCSVLMVR